MPRFMDATDALAVAYCHFIDSTNIIKLQTPPAKRTTKNKSSKLAWSDFIIKNKGRVKTN